MQITKLRYKILIFIIIFVVVSLNFYSLTRQVNKNEVKADVNDSVFLEIDTNDTTKFNYNGEVVMLKGVNVNNLQALGIWKSSNISNIEVGPGDYQKIAELGANHVRFGISYQWYLNNPVQFYNVLDNHVTWARQNNLWLIPSVFTLPYLNENTNDGLAHPSGGCYQGYGNPCNFWGTSQTAIDARTDFKDFIIEMVDRYKNNATVAGYDILNEPWSQDETYNRGIFSFDYFQNIITEIISGNHNTTQLFFLESEPEPLSWVLYQSYNGGVSKINSMIASTNNRIVLSAHMYEPSTLTHYSRVTYPTTEDGVVWNTSSMTNPTAPQSHPGSLIQTLRTGGSVVVNGVTYTDFSTYLTDYPHDIRNRFGISFAQLNLQIPIYIGEWSAQQTEQSDGSGWYTDTFLDYNNDIANLFDSWGVHDAVFEFKSHQENWGLYLESGPQTLNGFNEDLAYNVDNPTQTTQPFVDTLSTIWNTIVKPDFGEGLVVVQCQNGRLEAGEQCDDGNNVNGDGCTTLCIIEKKGPTIASTRNICSITSSFSDFRFDAHHEISSGSYNPASIPADSGYTRASQQLRLGNNGSNYYIPSLWFESVPLNLNQTVTNAYIDFNLASSPTVTALTSTVYGLKIGSNLRTYDNDGGSATRYFVDRNPYSTYLGGPNWVNWRSYTAGSATSPFVGFPHETLARSNGAVYQWPRTTASTSWVMPTGSLITGEYQATSNISTVLNELTAQSGWTSGNDLGFILIPGTGDSSSLRTFYGYDATITTGLNTYSFTGTNTDSTRFARLYANCADYVAGLSAVNDTFTFDYNTQLDGDVNANNGNGADANPGAYTKTFKLMDDAVYGTLTFNASNGTFSYIPDLDFFGVDSFRYVVSDGNGGTDDATVTLNVVGNSNPTVTASILYTGSLTVPYSFQSSASDSDGTIASYLWTKVSGPDAVTFGTPNATNTIATFTESGNYIIQISVTDNEGGVAYDTLNIEIPEPPIVTPPTTPPPATPPSNTNNNSGNTNTQTSQTVDDDDQTQTPVSSPISSPVVDKNIDKDITNVPNPATNSDSDEVNNALSTTTIIIILIGLTAGGVIVSLLIRSFRKDQD